ncbi:MAG: 3-hydroxybutyryl-CoA epimerase, partial [Archaeoglobaceae archaeon]
MDVKEAIEKMGFPIIPDEKSNAWQWFDVRELKLRYILSVEGIKKFYEGLKEGKLLATKCKCGRIF